MVANGTSYVVAVTGRGHNLQFGGGANMPMPIMYTIPTRTLGTNDSIAIRQAMQLNPFRKNFTSTEGQQTFVVSGDGTFTDVAASNIDVYINGTKYIWKPPGSNSDFTLTTNSIANVSYYNVTLSQPLSAGNEVDITVWPTVTATTYFSAGYMYQSIQNYSGKWLNVVNGGVRTAERLIIDGDLFVGGSIHFGCNTTSFESGAQWAGNPADITSNIIGTQNMIDGSITTPKILDGAVTSSKVNFLLGNIGIGTSIPTQRLDIGGNARMNTLLLEGSTLVGEPNVDDTSTNVYIKFNGSNSGANGDFAYIRQIGTPDNQSLALDFHDDVGGGEFAIRDVESSNQNPDIVRERMRILRDPQQRLVVNGSARFATSSTARYSYTVSGTCNIPQLPMADGLINGVNITNLNRRTRISPTIATRCVSTWTERTIISDVVNLSIDALCWSPNRSLFVGLTNGSNLSITSADGITWTRNTISATSRAWRTVTWAPELGLFVGFTNGSSTYAISSNGTTWTERTLTQGSRNAINIVWAPELSRFVVAVNNANIAMYSSDGLTWTDSSVISASAQSWEGLCWSPELGLFIMTANGGVYATSSNGITWTQRVISNVTTPIRSVCWSAEISLFVAVIQNSTVVLRSSDGINWIPSTIVPSGTPNWYHVSWNTELGMFIAFAANNTLLATSFNGEIWRTQAITNRDWSSAAWAPDLGIYVVAARTAFACATSAFAYPAPLNTIEAPQSYMSINNTNGRIGIGTTDPDRKLHIYNGDYLKIDGASSTDVGVEFMQRDVLTNRWAIYREGTSSNLNTYCSAAPNGGIVLCCRQNGNVGIGTNNPLARFHVHSDQTNPDTSVVSSSIRCIYGVTNSNAAYLQFHHPTAYWRIGTDASAFVVNYNGTISGMSLPVNGTNWTNTSDVRIKENIAPLSSALGSILQLRPVTFNFKHNKDKEHVGFIAQDVEPVLPHVVYTRKTEEYDDMKSISMTDMIPFMIKAMQEQNAKIQALESFIQSHFPNYIA
jgi:hypothetical protein